MIVMLIWRNCHSTENRIIFYTPRHNNLSLFPR